MCRIKEADEDAAKLAFILKAVTAPEPFAQEKTINPLVEEAIAWTARHPCNDINHARLTIVSHLEEVRVHMLGPFCCVSHVFLLRS